MYQWRKLNQDARAELLAARQLAKRPWHSPPHWVQEGPAWYHVSAACYEHAPIIGQSPQRIARFADELFESCKMSTLQLTAWCVLPNHYHLLVETDDLKNVTHSLGQLHGRSSRAWNLEDKTTARKTFHRASDRHIRSESHHWATLNYIHHNPVRHGYVKRWTDWPWSSAIDYLHAVGREEALRIWRAYPLLDYGEGWDDPKM